MAALRLRYGRDTVARAVGSHSKSMIMFPPAAPQHISAASQKRLSAYIFYPYHYDMIITYYCGDGPQLHQAERSRPGRAGSHAQEQRRAFGQLKHPVLFWDHVSLRYIEQLGTFTSKCLAYSPMVEAQKKKKRRTWQSKQNLRRSAVSVGSTLHFCDALGGIRSCVEQSIAQVMS